MDRRSAPLDSSIGSGNSNKHVPVKTGFNNQNQQKNLISFPSGTNIAMGQKTITISTPNAASSTNKPTQLLNVKARIQSYN